MKNSVVLFYPKTEKENVRIDIPLAPLKIGSQLKGAGYDVVIIDERFEEEYEKHLEDVIGSALFFGVSVMTGYQIYGALKASSFVRKNARGTSIVWGGWHPSVLPEETLKNDSIDVVVKGQGEITACELAKALKDGKDLKEVDGISYKKNGKIVSNKDRAFQDLNDFYPVRFDMLDFKKHIYRSPLGNIGERSIYWNTSQGCPYACGFCSTHTIFCRKWSGLNADQVLKEIGILVRDHNVDGITFTEDNFFVDVKRVERICRGLVDNKIKIKWATDVRIDQINHFSEELMGLLKDSGCSKLYVGAESGDQDVLDLVDKHIKTDDIYKTAERLNKYKIISEFFMIVGFPLDPEKDLRNSLELVRNIKSRYPDHQFTPFLYTPYPGTPLMETALKHGLRIPDKLEAWTDWSVLTVNTPWVDKAYYDKAKMFLKCIYPLAFPSSLLEEKFKKGFTGLLYSTLHRIEKFRLENDFLLFPIEWKLMKLFYYGLMVRLNLFKNLDSFR